MLGDAFRTGKDTVMRLIDGMKDATDKQKGALRKMFGDFFDRGIKDADLGKLDNIARAANEFGGLVESAVQFGSELDGGLKSLGAMVSTAGQLATTISSLVGSKSLSESFEALGKTLPLMGAVFSIGSAVSNFFNQKRNQDVANVQAQVDAANDRQLQATEAMTRALQMQLNIIEELYGVERLQEYETSLREISRTYRQVNQQLSGRYMMTGDSFTNSVLEGLNSGKTQSQIYKEVASKYSVVSKEYMSLAKIFKELNKYGRLPELPKDINKAREELIKLQTQIALNKGGVDEFTQSLLDQLEQQIDLYEETMRKSAEERTGNSFASLLSDVSNLFLNEGEDAGKAWSDGFNKVMENYMMQKFSRDFLQEKMQVWYDMLDDLSEGGITSSERDQLASEWEKIKEQGQQRLDEMKEVLGLIGGDGGNSSGVSGRINPNISEATGSEILAFERARYEYAVKQYTLLEKNGVDYIGIANAQLSELNAINLNTANTVARLDTAVGHLAVIVKNTSPQSMRQYGG